MITIDERTRAIFFCAFADDADWLGAVSDNPDGAGYLLQSRIRNYAEGSRDPFDGRDRKTWASSTINAPLAEVLAMMRKVGRTFAELASATGRQTYPPQSSELIRGDMTLDQFVAKLQTIRFAHSKVLS